MWVQCHHTGPYKSKLEAEGEGRSDAGGCDAEEGPHAEDTAPPEAGRAQDRGGHGTTALPGREPALFGAQVCADLLHQ